MGGEGFTEGQVSMPAVFAVWEEGSGKGSAPHQAGGVFPGICLRCGQRGGTVFRVSQQGAPGEGRGEMESPPVLKNFGGRKLTDGHPLFQLRGGFDERGREYEQGEIGIEKRI